MNQTKDVTSAEVYAVSNIQPLQCYTIPMNELTWFTGIICHRPLCTLPIFMPLYQVNMLMIFIGPIPMHKSTYLFLKAIL